MGESIDLMGRWAGFQKGPRLLFVSLPDLRCLHRDGDMKFSEPVSKEPEDLQRRLRGPIHGTTPNEVLNHSSQDPAPHGQDFLEDFRRGRTCECEGRTPQRKIEYCYPRGLSRIEAQNEVFYHPDSVSSEGFRFILDFSEGDLTLTSHSYDTGI